MSYIVLFTPELSDPSLPTSDLLLTPVIVSDNGSRFAMKKALRTVKQAFVFEAGFTLAQFIEEEGGVEGVQAMLDARGEDAAIERADSLAPTVEDGMQDVDEGC